MYMKMRIPQKVCVPRANAVLCGIFVCLLLFFAFKKLWVADMHRWKSFWAEGTHTHAHLRLNGDLYGDFSSIIIFHLVAIERCVACVYVCTDASSATSVHMAAIHVASYERMQLAHIWIEIEVKHILDFGSNERILVVLFFYLFDV